MTDSLIDMRYSLGFREWLIKKLGTQKWVIARKSPKLIDKGYDCFLSRERYKTLYGEYKMDRRKSL